MPRSSRLPPMVSRSSPSPQHRRPAGLRLLRLAPVLLAPLVLAGCPSRPSAESQRIDQLELKIQQLEQRINQGRTCVPIPPTRRASHPPV